METKEIVMLIFGGGGLLTGIATAISWFLNRRDAKNAAKAIEDAKRIAQSSESRKTEFDGLIRTSEFTGKEYQNIILILSKAKESAEAEFKGMRERYEKAYDVIINLERKVGTLETKEARCREDLRHLRLQVEELGKK